MCACKVEVVISEEMLQKCINALNASDVGSGTEPLTMQELKGNEKLMQFIAYELVCEAVDKFEIGEFINNDGWNEWEDYR